MIHSSGGGYIIISIVYSSSNSRSSRSLSPDSTPGNQDMLLPISHFNVLPTIEATTGSFAIHQPPPPFYPSKRL